MCTVCVLSGHVCTVCVLSGHVCTVCVLSGHVCTVCVLSVHVCTVCVLSGHVCTVCVALSAYTVGTYTLKCQTGTRSTHPTLERPQHWNLQLEPNALLPFFSTNVNGNQIRTKYTVNGIFGCIMVDTHTHTHTHTHTYTHTHTRAYVHSQRTLN